MLSEQLAGSYRQSVDTPGWPDWIPGRRYSDVTATLGRRMRVIGSLHSAMIVRTCEIRRRDISTLDDVARIIEAEWRIAGADQWGSVLIEFRHQPKPKPAEVFDPFAEVFDPFDDCHQVTP